MVKLIVKELTKKYGNHIIFDSIDININKKGFYMLSGRNGSGKSTFFKILKGIEEADSGSIEFYINNKLENMQNQVSYCPANPILFDSLTAFENVNIISDDQDSIGYYFNLFELNSLRNKKAKKLSAGEKIRVCIVRAILEKKPIILFDEITKHLDRRLRNIVLKEICALAKERIVLYTTHYSNDIPEEVEGVLIFDDLKLKYDSINSNDEIEFNESKINFKILKRVFNWKLNYIFLLLIILGITVISVFLTYLTEKEYESLYRHSLNQNSYILNYNGRQIIDENIYVDDFENLSKDYHSCYGVKNLFNVDDLAPEGNKEVFKCTIDIFNIVDEYERISLQNKQIVISDFIYFSLEYYNLIFEEENKRYFYFYDEIFEIIDVFETSFSNFIYLFEIENSNSVDEIVKENQVRMFEKLLEDYDFYFDYKYIYGQVYCNENSFKTLVKIRRKKAMENIYLDDILKDDNFSYELISGRMPETREEVVLTEELFLSLIKSKYGIVNKEMCEYLNEEYEYTIKSIDGKNNKIIRFFVVGVTSNITEEVDMFGEIKQRTLYTGVIDYDGSITDEIISWEGYYITNNTIGLTSNVDGKFAHEIYQKGYILINNNTLSLLNSYKIRDQFDGFIASVLATISIFVIVLMLLSSVLEYRFLKSNISVIDYLSIDKKSVFRIYSIRTIFLVFCFSFLLFVSCSFNSILAASYYSKILDVKVLLFDINYLLIICLVLLFVIMKITEKNILFCILKRSERDD